MTCYPAVWLLRLGAQLNACGRASHHGDDILDGGYGNDQLFLDAGNGTVIGGAGTTSSMVGWVSDSMSGGTGNDLFQFFHGDGRVHPANRPQLDQVIDQRPKDVQTVLAVSGQ